MRTFCLASALSALRQWVCSACGRVRPLILSAGAIPQPESSAPPLQQRLLVLGSSVATGAGADKDNDGWAQLLEATIQPQGFMVWNCAVGGTTAGYWNKAIDYEQGLDHFGIILLSLSLGNEGLPYEHSDQRMKRVEQHYLRALHSTVIKLRQKSPGARLVLGGPYPNDNYGQAHLDVLHRVVATMQTWNEVDHVINFLQPCVHDGQGRWRTGSNRDPGHPNTQGHRQMFECLDISAITDTPIEPEAAP